MPASASFTWLQLFAAIGLGTIIAALLSLWGARAIAISNHRQNWINALRDDLVNYLKEVDVLHFRVPKLLKKGSEEDLEKVEDSRNAAMLAYRRVLMRLNMRETLHLNLADRLKELMLIDSTTADPVKMEAAINASREVLKYEWAVAKYGIFTRSVLKAKHRWRTLHPRDH